MNQMVDVLLAVLYPPSCPGCLRPLGRAGPPRLCGSCRSGLGAIVDPCIRCAEPASAPICDRCEAERPPYERTFAGHPYREGETLAETLQRWKYRGDTEAGVALERVFLEAILPLGLCYDVIVPVPLHPAKLRRRGFNQASLLARALTRSCPETGLLAPELLQRSRSRTQASLRRRARKVNAAASFHARADLRGRTALVVDDVLTTGATVSACAATLRAQGAASIDVAVLARTPRPASSS